MEVIIYQVDAFTNKAFFGNPAGVVPDARGLREEEMQNIAMEMNLSETAFVKPIDKEEFEVRFFTPTCEVELCGHATIATFYTLAYKEYIENIQDGVIRKYQRTKAGRLPVDIYFEEGRPKKVMMFQGTPTFIGYMDETDELCSALCINKDDIGIKDLGVGPEIISTGLPDIIVPVRSKSVLDKLSPDFNKIKRISKKLNVIGIHAYSIEDLNDMSSIYCRNFAPLVGINEESATGTSNGGLIYYLKKNSILKGKTITVSQGLTLGRPSKIICEIDEENSNYIVKVGGECCLVMEGIISAK